MPLVQDETSYKPKMKLVSNYKKLGHKEFMSRWKKGIEGITPLQQTKTQLLFSYILVIGLLAGIVICFLNLRNLWWLLIILVAGLGNTFVSILALKQKQIALERIDETFEELNYRRDENV